MHRSSIAVFLALVVISVTAVFLGYAGIGIMKKHKVPPFNEGLYTATWMMKKPPNRIVAWCDSSGGRFTVAATTLIVPALFGDALIRLKWRVVGLGGMALVCTPVIWMGCWFWLWAHTQLE